MVHLLAFMFFAGILAGLAVLLQHTLRDNWADMAAAFMGRPMPGRVRPEVAVATVKAQPAPLRRAAA